MDARSRLVSHALALVEDNGVAGFSTRAVCERAAVTAPTLYHHFGDADGLISAAIERGFDEFLARKVALPRANDRAVDLLAGWDDYVAFARGRPRLYAAMIARVLSGGNIPAAAKARAHLVAKLEALDAEGRLALPASAAADLVWATAHSAALLFAGSSGGEPDPGVIAALRRGAEGVLRPPPN